MVTAKNILGQ